MNLFIITRQQLSGCFNRNKLLHVASPHDHVLNVFTVFHFLKPIVLMMLLMCLHASATILFRIYPQIDDYFGVESVIFPNPIQRVLLFV
mmetsp:Transcript_38968/g.81533  ORF Transcript_38968/g.81533 Transcript_38968/m.81533 type:complete len:89 (-) Transcript_38968:737-1003(-)